MGKDEMKLLTERLEAIQKVVNRIDNELGQDRHDLQEFALRLGAVEGIVDQLKIDINRLPKKVGIEVDGAMQPATDLKETIDAKKSFKIEIKRRWWEFWK